MTDPQVPYGRLMGIGCVILLVAAIADVAFEYTRAVASLQSWVCAGSGACEDAYVVLWLSTKFPIYAAVTGIAALVLESVRIAVRYFQSRMAPAVARAELFRWLVLVVALIAVAELVACAGNATCGLSKSCI